ncbi:MAG: two pore domain potassium channel family protein [Streptosporangiaceae bacterium]|nr:two pore domain potassium channel family protein [Streptosporangiaceae bacterium]
MYEGERARRPGRYGLVLVTLVATYLISAFTGGRGTEAAQIALFVAVTLLALRDAPLHPKMARKMGAAVLAGSAVAFVLALTDGDTGLGVASIWTGLMLLLTVVVTLRRVLSWDSVTVQSIYAALSAYLLIGLMFAAFYAAIDRLGTGSFFAKGQPANVHTFQYFSFTTLTTLGYGDFTAAGEGGRAVAVLEALTGQVFLATLVARLVSAFRRAEHPDLPPEDSPGRGGEPGTAVRKPSGLARVLKPLARREQNGAERSSGSPPGRRWPPKGRPAARTTRWPAW